MNGRKLTQSQKKLIRQWIKINPSIQDADDFSDQQYDELCKIHCTEVIYQEINYYMEKLQEDK